MLQEMYEDRLLKYLSGTLSTAEANEFEAYLDANKHLREEVIAYKKIWQQSGTLKVLDKIERCKFSDYQLVCGRIKSLSGQSNRNTRKIFNLRVAAAVGTLIVLSSAYWMYMNLPGFGRWQQVVARDHIEMVELPDHSTVVLNKSSKIAFLKDYNAEKRRVKLEGEAFFEVESNKAKPFLVENGDANIMVLGTSFNVKTTNGAISQVYVAEGAVKYSYKNNSVVLQKGETGYLKDGHLLKIKALDSSITSWKSNVLKFSNNTIDEVANSLALYFPEIKSVNNVSSKTAVKITTKFDNQSLDDIFNELRTHFNKKFELKEGILTISD
jgi:ferric-dicitrate binding protein FerR (iron transport regulator)